MHEVSLAGNILRIVEEASQREKFARVASVRIEAGVLAGVDAQALRFALDAITVGTCLAGASISIDEPPGTARCERCDSSHEVESCFDLCPNCGHYPLTITGGNDLRVVDLQVFPD